MKKSFKCLLPSLLLAIAVILAFRPIPPSSAYAGTSVYMDPPLVEKYVNTTFVGATFKVFLKFGNMTDLAGVEYKLYWNKTVLNYVGIKDTLPWASVYIGKNESTNNYDANYGRMWFVAVDTGGTPFTGSAQLREITFKIMSAPPSDSSSSLHTLIHITDEIFGDHLGNAILHDTWDGHFYYILPSGFVTYNYLVSVLGHNFTVTLVTNATAGPLNTTNLLSDMKISYNITGLLSTTGMSNITIPNFMLGGPYTVTVDGLPPLSGPIEIPVNSTHTMLSFTYSHSAHTIEITGSSVVPEFSGATLLAVLSAITAALVVYTHYSRRSRKFL
jgi:hypothetical protein